MKFRFVYAAVLAPVFAMAAVAACSSTTTTPGSDAGTNADDSGVGADGTSPETDAAVVKDAAPGSDASCTAYTGKIPGDAGAQCHDLENTAPSTAVVADPGTLPVGTGGKPADGLYHMTDVRTYPGSPVPLINFKYTVLVVGDMSYLVQDNSNEAKTVRKITKANPDGGPGIVLCTTKVENNPLTESSSTATCTTFTTYDKDYKFSATLTKQ
jgi:hypothetical protein